MKTIFFILALLVSGSTAEELKILSDNFKGDQQKGIAVFTGNVKIIKGKDELNATKVTVYTDKENKPVKYLAEGDVSFYIVTDYQEKYRGKAQSAIYMPNESEYQFYKKVDLLRLDNYRRVKGEKVVVNMVHGQAAAESSKDEPVMMIFSLEDKKPKSTAK